MVRFNALLVIWIFKPYPVKTSQHKPFLSKSSQMPSDIIQIGQNWVKIFNFTYMATDVVLLDFHFFKLFICLPFRFNVFSVDSLSILHAWIHRLSCYRLHVFIHVYYESLPFQKLLGHACLTFHFIWKSEVFLVSPFTASSSGLFSLGSKWEFFNSEWSLLVSGDVHFPFCSTHCQILWCISAWNCGFFLTLRFF